MKTNFITKAVLVIATALLFQSCEKDDGLESIISNPSLETSDVKKNSPNYSLSSWMRVINGNTNLSALSIPGTHDSGARYDSSFFSGTAKCQDLTIGEQLRSGTRFLDIRCRHINNNFAIHHGAVYQKLNFTDVVNYCYDFLNRNPTETIIMSVKEEHDPSNNNRSFEATLDSYINKNASKWYLGEHIPTLNTVRGKIVLLRRFHARNKPKGIDVTKWKDNTTFTINNGKEVLRIQDRYKISSNGTKWNKITSLLSDAKNGNRRTMYINFTSGYQSNWLGIPSIPKVSNNINPKITNYFNHNRAGRYGAILMDFATASRNKLIIETNF
ncbi:phosphatidylinositol-specific phospholipase C [Aquimarina aquimarini]|uniref:phosphatidylinositol-specific phospholipase C n=1 Tax=Aquimarina aquimarini TaxID=1191734 RepID=UPI000D55ACC8|nr:phosphatidylinositol-specific phospholipase C [Aquimarina aquimarini]